ncbi:MAG: phospholipase A [Gammaproteobacteria bacterium]|nr:phospholipase A [Gammaproteobacteria bacterium]MDP2347512.1 phospholipase A [Gammaproteobacteria bacterium]
MTTPPLPTRQQICLLLLALITFSFLSGKSYALQASLDDCLRTEVVNPANNSRTVSELRVLCGENPVRTRQITEGIIEAVPTITEGINTLVDSPYIPFFEPYKNNYIVFGSLENQNGSEPFSGKTLDIKFELGMKFSVFPQIAGFTALAPLKFGYSQRSWWDIAESSAPFKEHNYNPELFWDFTEALARPSSTPRLHIFDVAGFEHQSNGLDSINSRSWDRVYGQRELRYSEMLSWTVKVWDVVKEGEFNEDIADYLGNAEIITHVDLNNWANINLKTIKGHKTEKVSYQLDLILPMSRWINSRFVLSYYEGYGEALVSYNEKTKSLRAGFFFPLGF